MKLWDEFCVKRRILTLSKFGDVLTFGNGEVLGTYGLTVHESINAYLSISDTPESVIISTYAICSVDLPEVCLNSSFSNVEIIIPVKINNCG